MLRYSLTCDQGHGFESWFRDSAAFDMQRKRGLVSCIHCGSTQVEKAIMAPAVARRDRDSALPVAQTPAAGTAGPVALMSDKERAMRDALKALHQHVATTAENVGPAFSTTARQMHEGEIERRSIYGVATPDEVRALHEDGIEAYPLPPLPEDRN